MYNILYILYILYSGRAVPGLDVAGTWPGRCGRGRAVTGHSRLLPGV